MRQSVPETVLVKTEDTKRGLIGRMDHPREALTDAEGAHVGSGILTGGCRALRVRENRSVVGGRGVREETSRNPSMIENAGCNHPVEPILCQSSWRI